MGAPPFVEHCLELLASLGVVRAKRMFGGWGIWADEVFVALIADDHLYLKVGPDTQAAFGEAGCTPFVFDVRGRPTALGFYTAPAEALDSPALMAPWARLALQAALVSRSRPAARPPRPKRAPRPPRATRPPDSGP